MISCPSNVAILIDMRTHSVCSNSTQLTHVCVVEDTSSIVSSDDGEASVQAEVSGSDKLRGSTHFVPQRNLLVGNVPQTQFAVQRPTQKVTIVLTNADEPLC